MRTHTLRSLLAAVAGCLLLCQGLYATHAQGVDLRWQCLGGNTYTFTLTLYRDCSGISSPGSIRLELNSVSCATSALLVLQQQGQAIEVSPLCPSELSNSTCQGGSLPGVEQYTYSITYTLPFPCNDWEVGFRHCCRNAATTNLVNPSSNDLYIRGLLDNSGGLCNNSPIFTALPVPFICTGQTFCYNHGAYDPDGDSLAYRLVNALTGGYPGNNIPYVAPYSATYPLGDTSGTILFDPVTGSLCVTPDQAQVAVIAIQVDEYRNGVLIGSTMRDLQFVARNCANQYPFMSSGGIINLNNGTLVDSNSVTICPGSPLSFDVEFSDPDVADQITLSSNIGTLIPGATFTQTGTNPVTGTISWTPTNNDIGFYNFTMSIQDDGCPLLAAQVFSFDIRVLPSTSAGQDLSFCPSGGPVQINVGGGATSFSWNTLSGDPTGLSCTNCSNPIATPSMTSVYEVVTNATSCLSRDTITVNRVPDFNLNAGNDTTICLYGAAALNGVATPVAQGPYTFSWSPSVSLNSNSISNPVATPQSNTRYYMTVVSGQGCTRIDSVDVNISGVAPRVSIDPVDTLCEGVAIQLNSNVFYDCDTTSIPCSGSGATYELGQGLSAAANYGPGHISNGTPFSQRKQFIFTSAELQALGLRQGRINGIELDFASAGANINGLTVKMGCTQQDEWEFFPDQFLTGLTEVMPAFTFNPVTGWQALTFTHPYYWDGTSNLVIEFCVDNAQTGLSSLVRYTSISPLAYRGLIYQGNNMGGACGELQGTPDAGRPNIRFDFCDAVPAGLTYSWTPTSNLDNAGIANPVATLSSAATYTLYVNDGNCVGAAVVDLVTAPNFSLDIGNDTTLCRNVALQLAPAAPAGFAPYRYSWTPALGLSCINCSNPVATPPVTTAYIAEVTSADGCTVRDTLNLTVNDGAMLLDMPDDTTICPGAVPVNLAPQPYQVCGPTPYPCMGTVGSLIGTGGSSTSQNGPFFSGTVTAFSQRKQYIYTKQELDDLGFTGGGVISGVGMIIDFAGGQIEGLTIKMGCTTREEWRYPPYEFIEDLTIVQPPINVTPGSPFWTQNLATPYVWDGQSNLVVEFCVDTARNANASQVAATCFNTPQLFRTLVLNKVSANGACSDQFGTPATCRPDLIIAGCPGLPATVNYSWSPGASLSSTNTLSTDASPTSTTTYYLTTGNGSNCQNTDSVTIRIDSTAFVDVVASDNSPCIGEFVTLNALVTGTPATPPLGSCGLNGTTCSTTPQSNTVGSGFLSSIDYTPFRGGNTDARFMYLITASELNAAGITSGTLSELGFDVVVKGSSGSFQDLRIGLSCTNLSTLDGTVTAFPATSTVFGPQNYTTILGWNMFPFSNNFDWDGNSNLLVEVCFNNPNGTIVGNDEVSFEHTLGYIATMANRSSTNGTDGCTLSPFDRHDDRPNIRFTWCAPPQGNFTYSWTPVTGLSNPNSPTPTLNFSTDITYRVDIGGTDCPIRDSVTLVACPLNANELQLFGRLEDNHAWLEWIDPDPAQSNTFILTKSSDGQVFYPLQSMSADPRGQQNRYLLQDPNPLSGTAYYQVIRQDLNGKETFSNVEELNPDQVSRNSLYPNPAHLKAPLHMEYFSGTGGDLLLEWIDLVGKIHASEQLSIEAGRNLISLTPPDVAHGMWMVRSRHQGRRETFRVMLLK